MRKILLILLFSVTMFSCENSYLENNKSLIDSEKETNLKVLNKLDTSNVYYIVIDNDILYAISQDKVVEYKVEDNSGITNALIFIIFMLCASIIFLIFLLTD